MSTVMLLFLNHRVRVADGSLPLMTSVRSTSENLIP